MKMKSNLELLREKMTGRRHSEETRKKLSDKMKEITRTAKFKKTLSMIRARIKRKSLPKYLKRKGF